MLSDFITLLCLAWCMQTASHAMDVRYVSWPTLDSEFIDESLWIGMGD